MKKNRLNLARHTCSFIISSTLLFLLLSLPGRSVAQSTAEEFADEMSKHLVCYPMELIYLKKNLPSITTEELCLALIYHETGSEPIWVTENGPGPRARIILRHLQSAASHGLEPQQYKVNLIEQLFESDKASDLARLDTLITYNLAKYIHDISYGQLKPLESDPKLFAEAGDRNFNPVPAIEHARTTSDLDKFLAGLPPQHDHYLNLKMALRHYRSLAAKGKLPYLPDGPSLHVGDIDPRVKTLRARLQFTGDLSHDLPPGQRPHVYTQELEQAVLRFQRRNGLEPDGIVGRYTRAALNTPMQQKVETIRLNLARWRWQAHELGTKYVMVNIASFNLQAYENSGRDLRLNIPVIVGQEQFQTPVFSDSIRYLDINPFWNIPPSIAKNEELPELRKNPRHLVNRNIRLFSNWQADAVELDSTIIDWHQVPPGQIAGYKLRQDPGPGNALGKIKFVFPNKYSIYLHDTPTPNLFNYTRRNFSHGCIRVSDPLALALFLLKGQHGDWTREKVEEEYNQETRKVIRLSKPVPIHITYQTSWVDKDGTINFNSDIYARDEKLLNALLR